VQLQEISHGKRKGSSPAQLEGLDLPIDDWSKLIFSRDEDFRIDIRLITQYLKKNSS